MVACGLPSLLCCFALWKLPESPKFLMNQGRNEEARQIIAKMYRINTGKPESEFPVSMLINIINSQCYFYILNYYLPLNNFT